jgi:hypothetical protein
MRGEATLGAPQTAAMLGSTAGALESGPTILVDLKPPARGRCRARFPRRSPASTAGNRSRRSPSRRRRSPPTWRQTVGEHGGDYPYLAEVAAELVRRGYDYSEEFEFSLGFILERYRKTIRSWKRLR